VDALLISKIVEVFDPELESDSVTFDKVKQKLNGNVDLADIDPRKVYDKLRKIMSEKKKVECDVQLPTIVEKMDERVSRLLDNTSHADADTDDQSDPSIIGPSITSSKHIFKPEYVKQLSISCNHIVIEGPNSQKRVNEALSTSVQGQRLLREFKMEQLICLFLQ